MSESSAESDNKPSHTPDWVRALRDIPDEPPGPGDDEVPAGLSARSLTPDAILSMCEAWLEEAGQRIVGGLLRGDDEWDSLSGTIQTLLASKNIESQPVYEFERACQLSDSLSFEEIITKLGPAEANVNHLKMIATDEISQRLNQPANTSPKILKGKLGAGGTHPEDEKKPTPTQKAAMLASVLLAHHNFNSTDGNFKDAPATNAELCKALKWERADQVSRSMARIFGKKPMKKYKQFLTAKEIDRLEKHLERWSQKL